MTNRPIAVTKKDLTAPHFQTGGNAGGQRLRELRGQLGFHRLEAALVRRHEAALAWFRNAERQVIA